jgi:hypothetical protein
MDEEEMEVGPDKMTLEVGDTLIIDVMRPGCGSAVLSLRNVEIKSMWAGDKTKKIYLMPESGETHMTVQVH